MTQIFNNSETVTLFNIIFSKEKFLYRMYIWVINVPIEFVLSRVLVRFRI